MTAGISGTTKLLAVIGRPIGHSLSPRIHNRFAHELGMDYAYLAFDVVPETLEAFLAAACILPIAGFNATMPLKEHLPPLLDSADAQVSCYGACNTVVNHDGRLHGHNTDGEGFLLSLRMAGIEPGDANALILGAGGAAKAVAAALAQAGAAVCIACRRPDEVERIPGVTYGKWEESAGMAEKSGLLVNSTPLGMQGAAGDFEDFSFLDSLPPGAAVCDLIYAPRETALLKAAAERGLSAMNGLAHLVCQAALSFVFFTGVKPRAETIAALIREL